MLKNFFINFLVKRYGLSLLKILATKLAAVAATKAGIHIDPLELYGGAYLGVQGVWHWAEIKWPSLDPLHNTVPVN